MITVRYSASVSRVLIILGNPKGGRRKAWPSNEVTLPPSSNQKTWVRGPCSSHWRAGHSMNLAVWSNRSSSTSLCSCKNSLTSYKSVRHCHCLQRMWCSIRERQSIIMPSKKCPCLPTLQQGTPRVPRAGTSDAPFLFSVSREGSCQGGRDHELVFTKVWGSAIKCIARKSAGRVYSLKREVRKWELLKDKQQNEEQK